METFKARSRRGGAAKDSDDSIPSVVFPGAARCRAPSAPDVMDLDEGRHQVLSFFIFLAAIFQLVSSICVIGSVAFIVATNYLNGISDHLPLNIPVYIFLSSGVLFALGAYLCLINHNLNTLKFAKYLVSAILVLILNTACLTALIIYGYRTVNEIKHKNSLKFRTSMGEYYTSSGARSFFDGVQIEFDCCGVDGKHDWDIFNEGLPDSCCKKFTAGAACEEWKWKGCSEQFYLKTYVFLDFVIGFGWVALAIAVFAFVPINFAYFYSKKYMRVASLPLRDETENKSNDKDDEDSEGNVEGNSEEIIGETTRGNLNRDGELLNDRSNIDRIQENNQQPSQSHELPRELLP